MSAVAKRGTEEKDGFSGPSSSRRTKDHRFLQRKEVIIVMRRCLKKEEEIDNLRPSAELAGSSLILLRLSFISIHPAQR